MGRLPDFLEKPVVGECSALRVTEYKINHSLALGEDEELTSVAAAAASTVVFLSFVLAAGGIVSTRGR